MMFRARVRVTALLLFVLVAAVAVPAAAQEHRAAQPPPAPGEQPTTSGSQPAGEHAEAPHEEEALLTTVARLLNFAILAGVLVYYLKAPLITYLQSRSVQIRQDLVTAADMRKAATAQLEDIDRRMRTLPAELEELTARGAEDAQAEQARIAQAAATERQRLIDQMRREIDMRLRVARRELTEHAAQLAVQVARERIARTITADDQLRLLDRYTAQLKEAR